jgi:hypothetical protein
MVGYGTARNSIVGGLLRDAAAHEAGHFKEVGERFAPIDRELRRTGALGLTRLRTALAFWDGWIDARDRGWQPDAQIEKGEWPMLARRIASELSQDQEIADARVCARFGSVR